MFYPSNDQALSDRWITDLKVTDEGRLEWERERLILEVTEAIAKAMEAQRINGVELARRLGRSQSFVSKLLSGTNNFTLTTMADVFLSLGQSVHIVCSPAGDSARVPEIHGPPPRLTTWHADTHMCSQSLSQNKDTGPLAYFDQNCNVALSA